MESPRITLDVSVDMASRLDAYSGQPINELLDAAVDESFDWYVESVQLVRSPRESETPARVVLIGLMRKH